MIKNNKIFQFALVNSIPFLSAIFGIFFENKEISDSYSIMLSLIFCMVLNILFFFWIVKTIDYNAFLINIIFTVVFVLGQFFLRPYFDVGLLLSIPHLSFIGMIIIIFWIPIYLTPKIPTDYNSTIISQFQEVSILAGLFGTFISWVLIGSAYDLNNTNVDQLDNLSGGFSDAAISIMYGLAYSLIVFSSSKIENNISADENCFDKVKMNKSINYRILFSIMLLVFLIIGSIAYALYVEGAAGGFGDFISIGSIPLIVFILLTTMIKSQNFKYLPSLKILVYNPFGDYDIKQTSFTIGVIKQLIVYLATFLIIMFFVASFTLNLVYALNLMSVISSILFTLFFIYFVVMMQDVAILQNAIIKGRFDEYKSSNNASGIYVLCSIYIGVLSFIVLVNFIRI
tara:strand:- start:683 stop:1879 length:1197 start_codon:yes stop_codon:yes gene_type:complete